MHRVPSPPPTHDPLLTPHCEPPVIPVEELVSIRDRSPNVLIIGPDPLTGAAIGQLRPLLRLPVVQIQADSIESLPRLLTRGTVIVRGVHTIGIAEQHRLFDWMTQTAGATQVVATSAASLLSLLERGLFFDLLYYRLNTICLDLGGD